MKHLKEALVERDGTQYELVLGYDDNPDDPRECTGGSMLCFRKHRRMDFPNEAGFDFDRFDEIIGSDDPEDIEELKKMFEFDGPGHLFWIDVYEHGSFAFSIAGKGPRCQFDTSRNAGFIFVDETDLEKASAYAEAQLEDYENYVNGNAYRIDVYATIPLFRADGTKSGMYETEYEETHCFYPNDKDGLPEWIRNALESDLEYL